MKYRKKPVVIYAWPIRELGERYNNHSLPLAVSNGVASEVLRFAPEGLYIKTLEGGMFGRPDDYLIMGVQGEFYACKPDIFAATYEPVTL